MSFPAIVWRYLAMQYSALIRYLRGRIYQLILFYILLASILILAFIGAIVMFKIVIVKILALNWMGYWDTFISILIGNH